MLTVLFIIVTMVAIFAFALVGLLLYDLWRDSALREDIMERRKKKRGEP